MEETRPPLPWRRRLEPSLCVVCKSSVLTPWFPLLRALRQPHISLSVSGGGERIRFPTVGDPFNFPQRTAGEYRFQPGGALVESCPHTAGDTCHADGLITQPAVPFTKLCHLLHAFALWFGGTNERRTRTLKRHRQGREVQATREAPCPDVFGGCSGCSCLTALMCVLVFAAGAVKSFRSVCFQKQSASLRDLFCDTFGCRMQLQLDARHVWSFAKTEASEPAGKLLGAHRVESSRCSSTSENLLRFMQL